MPHSAKKKRKKDNDDVTDLVHIRNELDQYVKRVEGLENERNHLLGRNAQLTEDKIMLERQLAEAQAKNESDVAKVEEQWKKKVLIVAEQQRKRMEMGAAPAPVEVESVLQQQECTVS